MTTPTPQPNSISLNALFDPNAPVPSPAPSSVTAPTDRTTSYTVTPPPVPSTVATRARRTRGSRLNPDAAPVLVTAVALVVILMVSSFIVSFSGIYEVSAWTGIPVWIQWLPAVFIDAAILAYTISLVVFKARGESTWRTFLGLIGFAAISVVANVAHTLSYWDGELADFRSWIGVAITASAPIAVLLASEEITRLAFELPDEDRR